MALTKQQKILGAVVAFGIGAVCVDRFVLSSAASGPGPASAAAALAPAQDTALPKPASPTAAALNDAADLSVGRFTAHGELSDRLRLLAQDEALAVQGMVDAFVPRGEWGRSPDPEQRQEQAKPFAERHQLDAVMSVHGEWVALINGTTLRVGNVYDKHTVTRIEPDSVYLERDGHEVKLGLISTQNRAGSGR